MLDHTKIAKRNSWGDARAHTTAALLVGVVGGLDDQRGALPVAPRIPLPTADVLAEMGPAIERDGDVFGAAVNLAARDAAEAYAGEGLVTSGIAAVAAVIFPPMRCSGSVLRTNSLLRGASMTMFGR